MRNCKAAVRIIFTRAGWEYGGCRHRGIAKGILAIRQRVRPVGHGSQTEKRSRALFRDGQSLDKYRFGRDRLTEQAARDEFVKKLMKEGSVSCNPAQRARDQEDARTSLCQFFLIMGMSNETIKRTLRRLEATAGEDKAGCRAATFTTANVAEPIPSPRALRRSIAESGSRPGYRSNC
jgi:hypothetical protein